MWQALWDPEFEILTVPVPGASESIYDLPGRCPESIFFQPPSHCPALSPQPALGPLSPSVLGSSSSTPPGLGLQGHLIPHPSLQEVIFPRHPSHSPITAQKPPGLLLLLRVVAMLYPAWAPNPDLRVGNLGSREPSSSSSWPTLLATPLWACV